MKKFVKAQIKRIEIDKWLEGVKIKNDPGQEFVLNWIGENAPEFRYSWENSLCRKCRQTYSCGHKALHECDEFEEDI